MTRQWEPMLRELAGPRHGRLVAYATMLTGDRAAAEDIVQDALIATFGKRRTFPTVGHAEQYTRRAIASRFIDLARRSTRERAALERVAGQPAGASDERAAIDASDRIEALLATLPPRVRACIVLRYLDDQSIADTARALGLSEGSVKRYVSDGLAALNAALGTAESLEDHETAGVSPAKGGRR